MRYGIYSLAGLVLKLGFYPSSGDVFVFSGKRLDQIRLVQWDRDSFAMYAKKLEAGTLEWPKGNQVILVLRQYFVMEQDSLLFYDKMMLGLAPLGC